LSTSIFAQVNATKIDPKKWVEVYEDCLKIAKAGQLADTEVKTVRDYNIECLVPVKECGGKIHIIGDMVQGYCIQDYELERDVTKYLPNDADAGKDVDVIEYLYHIFFNEESEEEKYFTPYFGTKTFGNRPHMYLLAIACLISSSFTDAAVVYGDRITHGQCIEACKIVEEVTGRKGYIPIQYDYMKLYFMLFDRGFTGYDLLERYMVMFKGAWGPEFKKYIAEYIDESQLMRYFLEHKQSTDAADIVRDWLELGLSLDGLSKLFKELGKDVRDLIVYLIVGKVHIKRKPLYEFTRIDPFETVPDEEAMLEARMLAKNSGFERRVIDAYIPLEEMRESVKRSFPNDNTEQMIDDALAGNGKLFVRQKIVEAFYEEVEREFDRSKKSGDDLIITYDKIYEWSDETTKLDDDVRKMLFQVVLTYHSEGKKKLEKIKFFNPKRRKEYAVRWMKQKYPLPEDVTAHIIDSMDDTDYSALYFGMLSTKIIRSYEKEIVRALLMKPGLYDYAMQLLKEAESEKRD